ncbi:L-threonylcarbamoyladenylate synthase [Arthrobacter sp. Br18]|uniref:L-threonylcarbamoyladenylate synthase n=1 Tax=Arthrobacter sp. Br18 TaxID=1312954 RepID=UPI00047CB694|nr:L-threonylcarbamoyladenylate synthase [Arthrobacter sp. Br18]
MTTSYDCSDPNQRSEGLAAAQRALAARQCVVIPTDTVYGIAADAFSPQAVATLLASKGRGRNMPPPVLIPRIQTLDGLAADVHPDARRLAAQFWPGALTIIFHAQPSLTWDLGETLGTVALRMPDDRVALDLLAMTGPLAVSSANRTGHPAATTAAEAVSQLAESAAVYLDDGERSGGSAVGSTIVDATGDLLRVVRPGPISLDRLRGAVPTLLDIDEVAGVDAEAAASDTGLPDDRAPDAPSSAVPSGIRHPAGGSTAVTVSDPAPPARPQLPERP